MNFRVSLEEVSYSMHRQADYSPSRLKFNFTQNAKTSEVHNFALPVLLKVHCIYTDFSYCFIYTVCISICILYDCCTHRNTYSTFDLFYSHAFKLDFQFTVFSVELCRRVFTDFSRFPNEIFQKFFQMISFKENHFFLINTH